MRADIDRIEMQRERQQHHGVHRAGRVGDHHVGRSATTEMPTTSSEHRGDRDRHGERAERGADIVQQHAQRRALAKREPVTAPNAIITVLLPPTTASPHGRSRCRAAPPSVSMAPNRRPPGKRSAIGDERTTVEATTSDRASSPSSAGLNGPAPRSRLARPTRPNSASPPASRPRRSAPAWSARWRSRACRRRARRRAPSPATSPPGARAEIAPTACPSRARGADRRSPRPLMQTMVDTIRSAMLSG